MRRMAVVAAIALTPALAHAQESDKGGGKGESCRARADCKAGLKCIDQVCSDGSTSSSDDEPKRKRSASDRDSGDWLDFSLEGVHPFVGLTWAGGFQTAGTTGRNAGGFNTFNGAFLFAIHGGVFIDRHQLQLELAPITYFYSFARGVPGPAFELTGSYAYFLPLYEGNAVKLYWPLRVGVGFLAAPDRNLGGNVWFQPRADLIGLGLQIGHVMIDMHLPSFRYAMTSFSAGPAGGVELHLLSWLFGASASYVF